MKNTDFHQTLKAIQIQERRELTLALKAHSGRYKWTDTKNCPCILINVDIPTDLLVLEARLEKYGITIVGKDVQGGDIITMGAEDVVVGHLSAITDMIPEAISVKSVCIPHGDGWMTLDELINLQYITAYMVARVDYSWESDWTGTFDYCRTIAKEFSDNEPNWETSDTDYETSIQRFCDERLGDLQ